MIKSKKITKILIILIFMTASLFLDNQYEVSNKSDLENSNFEKFDEIHETIKSPALSQNLIGETSQQFHLKQSDIAKFNVSESVLNKIPFNNSYQKTLLDIDNTNMTVDVLDKFSFSKQQTNISAIYKNWEILEDNDVSQSKWDFTSYPNTLLPQNFMVAGSQNNELRIYSSGTLGLGTIPEDSFGQFSQLQSKPDDNLEIWETELVSPGSQEYPLVQDFRNNPSNPDTHNWTKNYDNPYGGKTESREVDLAWTSQDGGMLLSYIGTAQNALELGNPSISWETDFNWSREFTPEKVYVQITWSKENYGYEEDDGVQIISRINGQPIDGTVDVYGNIYNTATTTTIAYDDTSEKCQSHGEITRIFDVTDLIDPNQNFNTFDFGVWMEHPDETDDSVLVALNNLIIVAVKEDQYKIGEVQFDAQASTSDQTALEDWIVYYSLSNSSNISLDSAMIVQSLGFVPDFFNGQTSVSKVINLTTRFKQILNSDTIKFSIGIKYMGPRTTYLQSFQIKFDNLYLEPIYKAIDNTVVYLQRWNGGGWDNIQNDYFETYDSYDEIQNEVKISFKVNNEDYGGSIIEFESNLLYTNYLVNNASASFEISSENPTTVSWEVKYNNTASVSTIINSFGVIRNYYPTAYNMSLIDIPAYDGLGNESLDWVPTGVIDPLNNSEPSYTLGIRNNGTNNNGYTQNLTLINPIFEYEEGHINGTWLIYLESPNYLFETSIQNPATKNKISKVYDYNITDIVVNRTEFSYSSPSQGNYNITIVNATGDALDQTSTQYLQHHDSIEGNLTVSWDVRDEGIGKHYVIALWNDTNGIQLQTTRIGFNFYEFGMWRNTSATLYLEPDSSINAGEKAYFKFNYTDSFGNPISSASSYTKLYRNATNNLWGVDWPPFVYLVESVSENTSSYENYGNYTLIARTTGVPSGIHELYINLTKPYYDHQILYSSIKILGDSLKIELLYGISNSSNYLSLENYNLPFVNDTSSSHIQVKVMNQTEGILSGGIISGIFNGSTKVFYGFELYTQTSNPEDKGIYNITLDATGLNSTLRDDINFYNLSLTISIDGFQSTNLEVECQIMPMPTNIEGSQLENIYEGGEFSIFTNYETIFGVGINNANVSWQLLNASDDIVISGVLDLVLSGLYEVTIELETTQYDIEPGFYTLIINASSLDCANASLIYEVFEVYSKETAELKLFVDEDNIRIGSTLYIEAEMTNIDENPIINAEIVFNITFNQSSFEIVKTTNLDGIATYSQIIPFQYANNPIIIEAYYSGNSTTKSSSDYFSSIIGGKLQTQVNITYESNLRVGYGITIHANISIEGFSKYTTGIYLTLAAWYDGNSDQPIFIRLTSCNENGTVEYYIGEIADNYENLTIYVDYASTNTHNFASNQKTLNIIPKWAVDIKQLNQLSDIRLGQNIEFLINASFIDIGSLESLTGLPLIIYIETQSGTIIETRYFDSDYIIDFDYSIPLSAGDQINITYSFIGTSKISGFEFKEIYTILPQLQTQIAVLSSKTQQGFSGEYIISIKLHDQDDQFLAGQAVVFEIMRTNKDGTMILESIAEKTVITNSEGIASYSYIFEEVGYYSVQVYYEGQNIYSSNEYSGEIKIEIDDYFSLIQKKYDIILIIIGSIIALGLLTRQYYVLPKRAKQRQALMEIHRRFADVENVQYLLIIHKKNGMSLFSWSFSEIPIDETLIGGFLSAIGSFGEEIGEKVSQKNSPEGLKNATEDDYINQPKGLEELAYGQFKIALIESKYIKTAVLLLKKPSDSLKNKIKAFNAEYEQKNEDELSNWKGRVPDSQPILKLIEKHLYADLLYPHNIVEGRVSQYLQNIKKKSTEGYILEDAEKVFDNTFYVREMINQMTAYGKNEIETFNAIEQLRKDNIVFAINPRTQILIDKFKPLIDLLNQNEKKILLSSEGGIRNIKSFAKSLNVDVDKIQEAIERLQKIGYLDDNKNLTEQGEALVTIMNLITQI